MKTTLLFGNQGGAHETDALRISASVFISAMKQAVPLGPGDNSIAIIALSVPAQLAGIAAAVAHRKNIVMVNPAYADEQIQRMLSVVSAETILGDDECVRRFQAKFNCLQIPELESIGLGGAGIEDREWFVPEFTVSLFTSGSSGEPKAVPLSYANLLAAYSQSDPVLHYAKSDCWLLSLPLYHISGFSILFRALQSGCDLIIPANGSQAELEAVLQRSRVTHLSVVPTQLQRLLDNRCPPPEGLRATFLGGAPSDAGLVQRSIEAGWKTIKVFGSTETAAYIALLLPHEFPSRPLASGRALPGVTLTIEGEENGIGEITVAADSVSSGYLNGSGESALKFRDGKYFTGDIGSIDAEGFLTFHGRKDAAIITGGEKVHPFIVEKALLATGLVSEAVVFGIPDAEWGQAVVCVLVLKPGVQTDTADVQRLLREKLAPYQIPKKIRILPQLPFDQTGKLRQSELLRYFTETE
jgi:O-succinylbenzoic acid--CoA ligase